jgi:hypothetical protein
MRNTRRIRQTTHHRLQTQLHVVVCESKKRTCSLCLCLCLQSGLLGGLGLRGVLGQQLEERGGLSAVQRLAELVDCRGSLQPLVEDAALALQADILGPLDKAGHVAHGLHSGEISDVSSNNK